MRHWNNLLLSCSCWKIVILIQAKENYALLRLYLLREAVGVPQDLFLLSGVACLISFSSDFLAALPLKKI